MVLEFGSQGSQKTTSQTQRPVPIVNLPSLVPQISQANPPSISFEDIERSNTQQSTLPEEPNPKWQLFRNHTAVTTCWDEYTDGYLNTPSIRKLDEKYGVKWRNTTSERQFYCKRKHIYFAIKEGSSRLRISLTQTSDLLESKRKELGMALAAFQIWIKKNLENF